MLFQNTGLTRAMYQFFQTLIYVAPATLFAVSLHEFAHGYVSYKLGDMTPKYDGRLTLNPFKHLDVWGTLCLLVFHVNRLPSAKGVDFMSIQAGRLVLTEVKNCKGHEADANWRIWPNNKKRDTILVAAAGVVMNFLLAFVCMILHGLLYKYGSSGLILNYLYVLTYYGAVLNIGLGVFNLIPIPPLDGSNILAEIFPRVAEFYWKIRPYSMWILLLLLGTGILDVPISLLNSAVINGMWSFVKAILRVGFVTTGGGTVI